MKKTFRALLATKKSDIHSCDFTDIAVIDLPDGDVRVKVTHSSLNYKDAMAIMGTGKIIKNYPMIPGVDLSGTVLESRSNLFKPGDEIIHTGWFAGEHTWGGFTELSSLNSENIILMPKGLDPYKAMAIGSAGLTSMLCVMALEEQGITPNSGKILVTGAGGGVGGYAVAILAGLGYEVTAVTGKEKDIAHLMELGAKNVIMRKEFEVDAKSLEKRLWAGAIDTVGGKVLAKILPQMDYGATVAATGLTGGSELNTTVFPFILRAVKLVGVEVTVCPTAIRKSAWERLANELPVSVYESMTNEIPFNQLPDYAKKLLSGNVTGRIVINITSD